MDGRHKKPPPIVKDWPVADGDHLCANRSFLTRAYPTMKKNNPNIPIMLREAAGTVPKVYARYGALGELPIVYVSCRDPS